MYFSIQNVTRWENFSYALFKHPDSTYDRTKETSETIVYRTYATYDDSRTIFSGYIARAALPYLKAARDRNESAYIFAEKSAVSPVNLNVFFDVFRNTIQGKFDQLTDIAPLEEFFGAR